MVNNIANNISTLWLKEIPQETRSVWIKNKSGKIELVKRHEYSWFKHCGRFQTILESMSKDLTVLSKTNDPYEIQTIIDLKAKVDQRYQKYRATHKTTSLLGRLYLWLFAKSLDKCYENFKNAVFVNLKKQLLNLPEKEFDEMVRVLPLHQIDVYALTDDQVSKIINEKIKNFNSLSDSDKHELSKLQFAAKINNEQFKVLLEKFPIYASNMGRLQSDEKKKIVIENLFAKPDALLEDDISYLWNYTKLMTTDQFNTLIDKNEGPVPFYGQSEFTPERLLICFEKKKIRIRYFDQATLDQITPFLSESDFHALDSCNKPQLKVTLLSSSQILRILKDLSLAQKQAINFSKWTAADVLKFQGSLTNADQHPYFSSLSLGSWSESEKTKFFMHYNLNGHRLDPKFLESNFNLIPDTFIKHLMPTELNKIDFASKPEIANRFFPLLSPDQIQMINVSAGILLSQINNLSAGQIERINFGQFNYEDLGRLIDALAGHVSSGKIPNINLRSVNLSKNFTPEQISDLFDRAGDPNYFNIKAYFSRIPPSVYQYFDEGVCRTLSFTMLTHEQQDSFTSEQRSWMLP